MKVTVIPIVASTQGKIFKGQEKRLSEQEIEEESRIS